MTNKLPPAQTMEFAFILCHECCDKYKTLRFDPTCTYELNMMPLCSLVWPDEHPEHWFRRCCDPCQESIRRLADARTYLWRCGEIRSEHLTLWQQAQDVIPDWPGFKRLSLDEDQNKSLDDCAGELGEMLEGIAQDFPNFKLVDRVAGQVGFTAARA